MKALYALVPVVAVLTAVVFLQAPPKLDSASAPAPVARDMAALRLERVPPASLPARSPVTATVPATNKPLSGMVIVVDPGHGGQTKWDKVKYTGGTKGVVTGQTESDVNLRVSLLLREYLQAAGATVHMTRVTDDRCTMGEKTEELDFRSNMANRLGADLFLSVHHNHAENPNTNYTCVFYPDGMPSAVSLADNISNTVARALGNNNVGAKLGKYRVLSGLRVPGVIIESAFLTNPAEDLRQQSLAYNKLQARAIFVGVANHVRLTKGRNFDFNAILAPIDDQAGSVQQFADATFVRRQIVEKRSLFGKKWEEIVTDAYGNVVSRRDIGDSSLRTAQRSGRSRSADDADESGKQHSSRSGGNRSTSKTARVVDARSGKVLASSKKSSSVKSSSTKATASSSKKASSTSAKASTSGSNKQTASSSKATGSGIRIVTSKPTSSAKKSASASSDALPVRKKPSRS